MPTDSLNYKEMLLNYIFTNLNSSLECFANTRKTVIAGKYLVDYQLQ